LDAPRCPVCGWTRPAAVGLGQPAWGPLELNGGLGGPGKSTFAGMAAVSGVVAVPQRDGSIAGLNLGDGSQRWRVVLPQGCMARRLVADGGRLLLAISDERSPEQAGPGRLAVLDPGDGQFETVYQAQTPLLSAPLLAADKLLLRTAQPELLALARGGSFQPLWRQPLQAWWSLAPFVAGETVLVPDGQVMQGEGLLLAFAQADGRRLWQQPTDGLLAYPPVACGNILLIRDGWRNLAALALDSGRALWPPRSYERIYSNLAASAKQVYLVVRGQAEASQPGHYLLQSLDAAANRVVWATPLPGRVTTLHLLNEQTLLMASDDGRLMACETRYGRLLWQYPLGTEMDPIQTELLVVDDLMLAGTYNGRLAALQVSVTVTPVMAEACLQLGDYEGAAAVFALQGDFRQAAQLYLEKLSEPEKALLLLEQGGFYEQAGDLAYQHQAFGRARQDYQQAGSLRKEAQSLAQMGDSLSSARLFEQNGNLLDAARQYEKGNELRRAMELFAKTNQQEDYRRLRALVPATLGDVEALERAGQLLEAGEAAMQMMAWRKAVDLFHRAALPEQELAAIQKLALSEGQDWAWQRQAELAQAGEEYDLEAQAWEHLGQDLLAAQACCRAAVQAEASAVLDEVGAAALYERAAHYYAMAGEETRRWECWTKVVYYQRLPWLVLNASAQKAFREGDINTVNIRFTNIGRSGARNIQIVSNSAIFELVYATPNLPIPGLGPQLGLDVQLYMRPSLDVSGEAAPLELRWSWQDHRGQGYNDHFSVSVNVRERAAAAGGTPVNIYNAPIYGDLVGRDKKTLNETDQSAQPAAPFGPGMTLNPLGSTQKVCSQCQRLVPLSDLFCRYCGRAFKSTTT
jgi:outer membrane protein assembly factor BamB